MAFTACAKKFTSPKKGETATHHLVGYLASGFFFTISNPITVIGVMAVVAAFAGPLSYWQAATLTGGIFSGSLLWWTFLCGGTFLVRRHFNDKAINAVNRGTAVLLIILASWALYTGVAAKMGYPIVGPHFQKQFAFEPLKK